MKDVRFGIIPAAGLGTRFLPASGAVPKELFPIFDTPLIAFGIEEMLEAGVETVFIIVSPWKEPLFDRYLKIVDELEDRLNEQGKTEIQAKLQGMRQWPKIKLVVQKQPQGLAQALALCKDQIGEEAFCVLLPDEVLLPENTSDMRPLKKLVECFSQTHKSCVGLYEVKQHEVSQYGVAKLSNSLQKTLSEKLKTSVWSLEHLVEKPKPEAAPSKMMLPGRYLFTADFWQALESDLDGLKDLKKYAEVHITEALDRLAKAEQLLGVELKHDRFDAGQPQGFLDLSFYHAKNQKEAQ